MSTVIAFDPGYGNTKICIDQQTTVLQSVVVRPRSVGLAATGMKSATQVTQVQIGDRLFGVGSGAWHWGDVYSNLDYTALASLERRALFYAGYAQLMQPGEFNFDMLVIGLPVPLLQNEQEAQRVMNNLKNYKGVHEFEVNQQFYRVTIDHVKAMAQPAGAYANWLLDSELRSRKSARQCEVAVLDIGMNTADLYVVQDGRVEPRYIGGGKLGVRRLFNLLSDDGHDMQELDMELQSGRLRLPEKGLESWMEEIMGLVERTWPSLKRFSAVIPAGGGSAILGDMLRVTLASKGAALYWPENLVTANVVGLWKYTTARIIREASHASNS